MELRHLRYFVAVAEELSFRRAAERLHVSQPPLSQQIMDLEEEIGTSLFIRTNRSVRLTEAGAVFLKNARRILSHAERAKREALLASEGKVGTLKIFFAPSVASGFLKQVLKQFKERYPQVHVVLEQSTSGTMPDQLVDEQMDIGLVRLPIKVSAGIDLNVLLEEDYVVALPIDHPLAKAKKLTIKQLVDEEFIATPRHASPYYHDTVMSLFSREGVVPTVKQEAIEQFTIAGLVASGMGIAIVPEIMTTVTFPGLCHVPLVGGEGKTGIGAITRKEDNVLVKNFLECFG